MNSLIVFLPFNLFTNPKEERFKYILFLGFFFDWILYKLPFLNTILFLGLYLLNRKQKNCRNLLFFIGKGIFNLSIGLLAYAIYSGHFSLLLTLWPSYITNILCSILFYKFQRKTLEMKET